MQHKLKKGLLIAQDGRLSEAGYATDLIKAYNRPDIKASKLRIKEWDYFYIHNQKHGIGLTIADNGYMGLLSVAVMDFENKTVKVKHKTLWLTLGKLNLSCTSIDGKTVINEKGVVINLDYGKDKSYIKVYWDNFEAKKPLELDVTLSDKPKDSMVLTVPFKDKPHHFYYNQKILAMRAVGTLKYANTSVHINKNGLAMMDFGRGVWPYKTQWYWGAAQGVQQNQRIALNIGHGFGDTTKASEDMFFVDGVAHKLSHGQFEWTKAEDNTVDLMKKWRYKTTDGRLDVVFEPVLQRQENTNLGLLKSNQNQIFGYYNGTVVLDDHTKYDIKDLFGFAESFVNRW